LIERDVALNKTLENCTPKGPSVFLILYI